ncbi:MAG: pentapeptide repeat-containing protein [Caldilineaceae bacterium]
MLLRTLTTTILLFLALLFCGLVLIRFAITRSITCVPRCVGMNLTDRNLQGLDLQKARLMEAQLQNADLSGANLREADLSGANLVRANLRNADLTDARLIGADLTGARLEGTLLKGADLSGANLSEADLTNVDLHDSLLGGANFVKAKLTNVQLQGANLAGLNFSEAGMTGANLERTVLAGAALSRADLSGATLVQSDLTGAWLNLTNLVGANVTEADLGGSSLIGAELASTNLQGANLAGTILIGAQLHGANLRSTNLQDARTLLTQLPPRALQLDPLLLELTELQRTALLQDAHLEGIAFDARTIWPDGAAAAATISPENRLLTTQPSSGRIPVTDATTAESNTAAGLPSAKRVLVNFFINSLRNIDPQHGQFTADFYLDLDWLEPDIPLEQDITALDPATLWNPRPLLVNAGKGGFLFEFYTNSNEPEHNVSFNTRVIGDFTTNFDLRNFPFDQQALIIQLEPSSGNSDEVLFEFIDLNQRQTPSEQPYVQPIPPGRYVDSQVVGNEWALRDIRIAQRLFIYTNDQSSYSRFQIEVTLARRAAPYVWKYILPMFLLACFAWSVCLVDMANVATRFRLLAILLVTLGALHVVLWQALPQTSYLTYLDRLLLLHYSLLLGLIGLVFLGKFLHDRRYLRSALWLNRILLVGYPLSYVALNFLLYWPLAR